MQLVTRRSRSARNGFCPPITSPEDASGTSDDPIRTPVLETKAADAARAVLARLKDETAGDHARVDALVDPMLSDLAGYRRLLIGLRDAHRVIESQLQRHAPALARGGYDAPQRSKLGWLADDLAFLGVSESDGTTDAVRFSLADVTAAFGAVYVVEGATLGGRVIARRVIPALSLSPTAGCRYFSGYGAETRDRWRSTGDAIAAHASHASAAAVSCMVGAAKETFALFETMLREQCRS